MPSPVPGFSPSSRALLLSSEGAAAPSPGREPRGVLSTGGRLAAAVGQALATGQTGEVASQLAELREHPDLPAYLQALIPALQAILSGSRDPALASDPALDYDDAAEIVLLLEALEEAT